MPTDFDYCWMFYWTDGTTSSANTPFGDVGRIGANDAWMNRFNAEYPLYWRKLSDGKELDYVEITTNEFDAI